MLVKATLLAIALSGAALPSAAAAGAFSFDGPRTLASAGGWRGPEGQARDRVRGGDILPLPRILGEIKRRTPGRLLDAGLEDGPGGRPVYRIRWATEDGRRIDYLVDARSGEILRADGG